MRKGTFFFQTQGRREVVWVQRGHWPHPGKFLDFDFSKFSKKVSCACFKFSNQKIELFIIWPFGWIIWQSLGEMWGGGNFLGLLFLGDFHQWPACCLHFPLHPGHGIKIGLLCLINHFFQVLLGLLMATLFKNRKLSSVLRRWKFEMPRPRYELKSLMPMLIFDAASIIDRVDWSGSLNWLKGHCRIVNI